MKAAGKLASLFTALAMAMFLVPAGAFAQTDPGPAGSSKPTLADELPASYMQVDLSAEGMLETPEDSDVTTSTEEGTRGIFLKGTPSQLDGLRIPVNFDFEFEDDRPVGRVSIDAVAPAGVDVTASIFLDDATEPLAEIELEQVIAKYAWATLGDRTADILAARISGSHRATIGLTVNSSSADGQMSILIRSIEFAQNSLPVIYFDLAKTKSDLTDKQIGKGYGTIDEMNSSQNHSVRTSGNMRIQVPEGYTNEYAAAESDYNSLKLDYIRGRGNSTWTTDYSYKRPYKFKLKDKPDLFGMGADNHWVLVANDFDTTLSKNRMTYWLGRQLGMEYTPECVPVEVVMNNEYLGSFLLCEQVRAGEERVNIGDPVDDPDNFDEGGYLLSVAQNGKPKEDLFTTTHNFELMNVCPSFEDNGPEADEADRLENLNASLTYIRDYMQEAEEAIFGADFKNSDGKGYEDYLDMDSATKYFWVQELSKNGDAYITGSTYLYKKGSADGGKIYFGPLWDFDLAWDYIEPAETDYPEAHILHHSLTPWFNQLKGDENFREALWSCWDNSIYPAMLEITKNGGLLDQYAEQIHASWTYDKEKRQYRILPSELGDDTDEQDAGNDDAAGPDGADDPNDGSVDDPAAAHGEDEDDGADNDYDYEDGIDEDLGNITGEPFEPFETVMRNLKESVQHSTDAVNSLNHRTLADSMRTVTYKFPDGTTEVDYVPVTRSVSYVPDIDVASDECFLGWPMPNGQMLNSGMEITENLVLKPLVKKRSDLVQVQQVFFKYYNADVNLFADTYVPSYTVVPANAEPKLITWSSSNETVARVDKEGCASLLACGTTTITATLDSGKAFSYELTVHEDSVPLTMKLTSLAFSNPKMALKVGEYGQLLIDGGPKPLGPDTFGLQLASSDESIATVDDNGVVHALKAGTARITVEQTYMAPFLSATATVTVTDPAAASAKKANPVKVKPKAKSLKAKASKLKKKAVKIKEKSAFKVTNAKGKVTFKRTAIKCKKKLLKQAKKKIKVAKSGKITLKKGLKRGTYRVVVKTTDAGNASFKKAVRTVTLKIVVK